MKLQNTRMPTGFKLSSNTSFQKTYAFQNSVVLLPNKKESILEKLLSDHKVISFENIFSF